MSESSDQAVRRVWGPELALGLLGVAVGAAIGAGTGMWWMMGVLGGVFAGSGAFVARRNR